MVMTSPRSIDHAGQIHIRPVRVAIYSRVSTDHQTTENQERELHAIADHMGWTVVKVYRDQGVSGAKSRENNRPAFDALCKDASRPASST